MKTAVFAEILTQAQRLLDDIEDFNVEEKEKILELVNLNLNGDFDGITTLVKGLKKEDAADYLQMAALLLERVQDDNMLYLAEHGDDEDLEKVLQFIETKEKFLDKALAEVKSQPQVAAAT